MYCACADSIRMTWGLNYDLLLRCTFQNFLISRLRSQPLYRLPNSTLLCDVSLSQSCRPLGVLSHHAQNAGIVCDRFNTDVPVLILDKTFIHSAVQQLLCLGDLSQNWRRAKSAPVADPGKERWALAFDQVRHRCMQGGLVCVVAAPRRNIARSETMPGPLLEWRINTSTLLSICLLPSNLLTTFTGSFWNSAVFADRNYNPIRPFPRYETSFFRWWERAFFPPSLARNKG
jgi:hypothetical protein